MLTFCGQGIGGPISYHVRPHIVRAVTQDSTDAQARLLTSINLQSMYYTVISYFSTFVQENYDLNHHPLWCKTKFIYETIKYEKVQITRIVEIKIKLDEIQMN